MKPQNNHKTFQSAPVGSLWILDLSQSVVDHINFIPGNHMSLPFENWIRLTDKSIVMKLGKTKIDEHSDIEMFLAKTKTGESVIGWLFSTKFLIPIEEKIK